MFVMEDVRRGPEKSESQILAAALAAWKEVAADENHLMSLAVLTTMNHLVNATLWNTRSGGAANKRCQYMRAYGVNCFLPFRCMAAPHYQDSLGQELASNIRFK